MAAGWAPHPEGLAQLLQLLRDSSVANPQLQQSVHQVRVFPRWLSATCASGTVSQHRLTCDLSDIPKRFYQLNQVPDFNNYLVYILTKLLSEQEYIRTIAGLLLKNNVKSNWQNMLPEVRAYIKAEMLQCLSDPMESVRHTVGSIITTIVSKEDSLDDWPGLLRALVMFLESPNPHAVDGSFSALVKLCEDSSSKLSAFGNGAALQVMFPLLLSFFHSPHERFRNYAIRCMNFFVIDMPPSFDAEAYMRGIFHLANDSSPAVRERVCHAFVLLLDVRLDFLMPFLREVVQYMMACTNDTARPQLALEACEFWYVLSDAKVCEEVLRDSLPQLVPILLKAMVYGPEELASLKDVETADNAMTPDRPQDIRPRHHKSRGAGGKPAGGGGGGGGDEAAGEEDDDNGEDDEEVSEWNLRKSAAAALDSLANVFKDRLLPILFPVLQERLRSPDWIVRESAVLAIGAVAEGCSSSMTPQLPTLIHFLLSQLQDKQPLIRSITCWTIGRYSSWIAEQDHEQFLRPVINELLRCILDNNKKVQQAGCSAFATLEEEAAEELLPYLGLILQHLMFAYKRYQAKNMLILYDAIATLADGIGSNLNQQQFIDILLPPLIDTWNALGDHDERIFPLLECLTSVVIALGTGFLVYATPVFQRCLRLIEAALLNQATGAPQEKDFAVCALDLISGLAEGLRSTMEHVVGDQAQHLAVLLLQCANDSVADVRQSTFALIGDLARTSIKLVLPIMAPLMQYLAVNIANASDTSACNNACWATGEIALKLGKDMAPFAPAVLERLIMLINSAGHNRSLMENCAITLGRVGHACPEIVAPHLERFVQRWCTALRIVKDDDEKESAFRGLCCLIKANPSGVVKNFVYVCDAIAAWSHPQMELRETFYSILHSFKNSLGRQHWADYFAQFPEQLQTTLREQYQL